MYSVIDNVEDSYKRLSEEIKKELADKFRNKGINVTNVDIIPNTGKINIEVHIEGELKNSFCFPNT